MRIHDLAGGAAAGRAARPRVAVTTTRTAAWVVAWAVLVTVTLLVRAPVPIDETRYLSVAWEMWRGGDWLVPRLNGAAYADKPPLLFWSILLAWHAFGVGELAARCVPALYALASLALLARLGRRLSRTDVPGAVDVGPLAALVLVGTFYWAAFTGAVMFDLVLATFVLAALNGVVRAHRSGTLLAWLPVGLALGGGVLAKGPAVLVHVLPVALLAPWWSAAVPGGGWRRWYAGVVLAAATGAVVALAWAVPAILLGGDAYRTDLLVGQTAGRVVGSFAHARPWWWYGPLLPALLAPWFAWPRVWSSTAAGLRGRTGAVGARPVRAGTRFCTVWFAGSVITFCAISGKQLHYLLPAFPAFALLVAHALAGDGPGSDVPRRRDRLPASLWALLLGGLLLVVTLGGDLIPALGASGFVPGRAAAWWGATLVVAGIGFVALPVAATRSPARLAGGATALGVLGVVCLELTLAPVLADRYDVAPLARRLGELERAGAPLAHVGEHDGQFALPGRLTRPVRELACADVPAWAAAHPDGWLVVPRAETAPDGAAVGPGREPEVFEYRSGRRALVPAGTAACPAVVHDAVSP